MNRPLIFIVIALLTLPLSTYGQNNVSSENISAETKNRLHELAAMLDESPRGFGSPIDDRETWERIANLPAFQNVVSHAEELAGEPVPELPDSLFLEFSRTGNRTNYQRPNSKRQSTLIRLVVAECIENRGRFIPAIERYMSAICTQKTWVLPAHDRRLDNFNGRKVEIHLVPAMTAWNIATVNCLLGSRLSPEIQKLMKDEVRRRVFEPFLEMVRTGENLMWWMTTTNNWNSVCIGGTAGAALAMIESPGERAWFLLGVERYTPNYLNGFTEDGYCSEGLGYWNYGFGHYLMLACAVRQATGGRLDLSDNEKVRRIAGFPVNLEILNGVYPAFADCRIDARPNTRYMRYLNRRYGFGIDTWEKAGRSSGGQIYELALFEVTDPLSEKSTAVKEARASEPRSWFEDAGVFIGRPSPGTEDGLAVALKGGHNAEHHNHNDVGSFVAVLDGKALLLDPGGEVYTGRTFSSQRYESGVLNSYGHPVPRIAGKLQRTGEDARARVVSRDFTDEKDTLVLDIASAYDVPELEKLERTFEYSRTGRGSLTITDRVMFSGAQTFETALITFSEWKLLDDGSLLVYDDDTAVRVVIETVGSNYEIRATEIKEDLPVKKYPARIGIVLKKKVKEAEVRVRIETLEIR